MSEENWERLERIEQESLVNAIEYGLRYENRSSVKIDLILDDVKFLFQQAERFEILSAQHDGALADNKRLRAALKEITVREIYTKGQSTDFGHEAKIIARRALEDNT